MPEMLSWKKCAGECGGQVGSGYEYCPGCTEGAKILNRNAIRLQREEKEKFRALVEELAGVCDRPLGPMDFTNVVLDLQARARKLLGRLS